MKEEFWDKGRVYHFKVWVTSGFEVLWITSKPGFTTSAPSWRQEHIGVPAPTVRLREVSVRREFTVIQVKWTNFRSS